MILNTYIEGVSTDITPTNTFELKAMQALSGKCPDNTPAIVYRTGVGFSEIPQGFTGIFIPDRTLGGKSLTLAEGIPTIKEGEEILIVFKPVVNVIPVLFQDGETLGQVIFVKNEEINIEKVVHIDIKENESNGGHEELARDGGSEETQGESEEGPGEPEVLEESNK